MIKIRFISFVTFVLTLAITSTTALSQSLNKPKTIQLRQPIKLAQNTQIFDMWNKYTTIREIYQFTKIFKLLNTAQGEELEKVFGYLIPASKQLAQYHKNQLNNIVSYIPIAQQQNGDVKLLKGLGEFSQETSKFFMLNHEYLKQLQIYKRSGDTNAIRRLNQTIGQLIETESKKLGTNLKILNNYYNANYASRQIMNSFMNRIPNNGEPDLLTIYQNGYNAGGGAVECALETYSCTPTYRYLP